MIDHMLVSFYPGMIYPSGNYRCQLCGQRGLAVGDGFLMGRCLNCGRYQHVDDSYRLGVGEFFKNVGKRAAVLVSKIRPNRGRSAMSSIMPSKGDAR